MLFLLIFSFICTGVTNAKLSISITCGATVDTVNISYSGVEVRVVTDSDVKQFKIDPRHLKEALEKHYGKKPSDCYIKSPTPWDDLYKKYNWEQVSRVLYIKSAKTKSISKKPVTVTTHDFENFSNKTIKVNTGITQTVENTVTTSWNRNNEFTVSEEVEYEMNIGVERAAARVGISFTSDWGRGEEKSETVTIGSTTAMETELKPNQAVTAVLSANRGVLEVDIVYAVMLRGNIAVNFKKPFRGHHFWGPSIQDVMKSGGLNNELATTETIRVGFYSDASLKVYDKTTGMPM